MEAQAGAISTTSPVPAYAPAASTARAITVSEGSGSITVRGMPGALAANASSIGFWSLPMMTAALIVCA